MFFSEYLGPALSVSFHQYSVLIFVYILILPGQTGFNWEPAKNMADYDIWEHFVEK